MNIKSDIVVDKKITTDEIEARVLDVSQNIYASNIYANSFDGTTNELITRIGNGLLKLGTGLDISKDFTSINRGEIKIVDAEGRTIIDNSNGDRLYLADNNIEVDFYYGITIATHLTVQGNTIIDNGNFTSPVILTSNISSQGHPIKIALSNINSIDDQHVFLQPYRYGSQEEFHIGLSTNGSANPALSIVSKSKTESAIRLSSKTDFVTKTIGVDGPDVLEMNNSVYITHDTGKHTLKEIADAAYTSGGGSVDTSNFLKKNNDNIVTNNFSIADDRSQRTLSLDYIVLGTTISLGSSYTDSIKGLCYYKGGNLSVHPYFEVASDHQEAINFSLGTNAHFSSDSGNLFDINLGKTASAGITLKTNNETLGLGTELQETSVYIKYGVINAIDANPNYKVTIGSHIRLTNGGNDDAIHIDGLGVTLRSGGAIYFTDRDIDEHTLRISSNDIRLGGTYSFIFHDDKKIHLTTNFDEPHITLTLATGIDATLNYDLFAISTNNGIRNAFAVTSEQGASYVNIFNGVKIGEGALEETGNLVTLTASNTNELLVNGKPIGGNSSTIYEFEITNTDKTGYTFSHNAGMHPTISVFKDYLDGNGVAISEQVLVLSTTQASQDGGEYTHTSTVTIQNTAIGETYTIKIS